MKHTPLRSIVEESFDRLFVVDKHGKTVFFPWGVKKQGYWIKSKSTVGKIKQFYSRSLITCFAILLIAMSIFTSFWGIIGSMFVCFGGWYFVYYLYTAKIVKYLPIVKESYKEVILEKLESEAIKETSQLDIQFPAQESQPVSPIQSDAFVGIKRILFRFTPGQLVMACFFAGIFTALLWSSYRPQQPGENSTDHAIGFLVCVLLGFASFVMVQNLETTKPDWFGFFRWKLPMIFVTVLCWSLAGWFLYKFLVLLLA